MTLNEYQDLAQRTSSHESQDGKINIIEFTEKLKADGYYIGDDSHIYSPRHKFASKECRNGYYTISRELNKTITRFTEHRVIWVWHHGSIDDKLVINHLNCVRGDNRIENLELVTHKQNMQYAKKKGRLNPPKGERNGRAILSNREAQTIRYLKKHGYRHKEIADLFGIPNVNTVSRVVTGARYGSVPDASDILAVYPIFVERMSKSELPTDQKLVEGCLGLAGEVGEVVDLVKKWMFHGHELDINAIIDELGDVLFYICMLCNTLGMDLSEVCYSNIAKLRARYPEGFDSERSIHREG